MILGRYKRVKFGELQQNLNPNNNEEIIDGRLRSRCVTGDKYLVFIDELTLVEMAAVDSGVTL